MVNGHPWVNGRHRCSRWAPELLLLTLQATGKIEFTISSAAAPGEGRPQSSVVRLPFAGAYELLERRMFLLPVPVPNSTRCSSAVPPPPPPPPFPLDAVLC